MTLSRQTHLSARQVLLFACFLLLQACGGGGGSSGATPLPVPPTPTPPPPPTTAQRTAAATTTAQSDTNFCSAVRPFYWEIGDKNAMLASGSVNSLTNPTVYASDTVMAIASASKWIFGAYVAQVHAGALTTDDIKYLNFRSGYTSFSGCETGHSVDECVSHLFNGIYHPADDGKYAYGGGHMQKHASLLGLGAMRNAELANEIRSKLGTEIVLNYSQPQLAGGIYTTAGDYAKFLRKLLGGQLTLGSQLGSHAVCTNPATCADALNSPVPSTESWSYSLGHWVETDPSVGDGAFSSAGAFGFYPWIDAGKTWYGIVARKQILPDQDLDEDFGGGYSSTQCGRLIRKAWITATAQ